MCLSCCELSCHELGAARFLPAFFEPVNLVNNNFLRTVPGISLVTIEILGAPSAKVLVTELQQVANIFWHRSLQ
jgi:hypothetical protein